MRRTSTGSSTRRLANAALTALPIRIAVEIGRTDSRWARVGSTNLNMASWFGNCEMDVVVEDESFASQMEQMYLQDLENATEIVLDARRKLRAPNQPRRARPILANRGGSAGRVAVGAIRIGNAVSAAFANRRVLEPVEARLTVTAGLSLLALAVLFAFCPRVLAYPLVLLLFWIASGLLYRGYKLHRDKVRQKMPPVSLENASGRPQRASPEPRR